MEPQNFDAVIAAHENECQKAILHFKKELTKVRTGRASTGLLEGVSAEYYGAKTPLTQLCQMSTPEARLIVLQVYDRSAVQAIEKAIQNAGLGLNPSSEGNTIRIAIPALTEESRKNIIKHLHKMAEDIRVSIRNHRRDANEHLKRLEKDSTITKDDSKRGVDRVQKITDAHITEVDKILSAKEAEIMEV